MTLETQLRRLERAVVQNGARLSRLERAVGLPDGTCMSTGQLHGLTDAETIDADAARELRQLVCGRKD